MSDDPTPLVDIHHGEVTVSVHPDRVPLVQESLRLEMTVFDAFIDEDKIAMVFGDCNDIYSFLDLVHDYSDDAPFQAQMLDWHVTATISFDEENGMFLTHFLWFPIASESTIVEALKSVEVNTVEVSRPVGAPN